MLRQWAYRDVVKYSSRSLRSASSPKAGSVTAQLAFLAKKILSGVVLMSRLLNATLDGFDVNLCVVRAFSAVRKIRAVDNFLWHYMPDMSRAVHGSRVCPGRVGRGDR